MGKSEDISVYDGKFTTAGFDMDETMIGAAEYDDIITFTVTARIVGIATSETRIGSLKKSCVFKVLGVGQQDSNQMTFDEALHDVQEGSGWINTDQQNITDREGRQRHPAGSAMIVNEHPDEEEDPEVFSPGQPKPEITNVKPFKLSSSASGGDEMLKKFLSE